MSTQPSTSSASGVGNVDSAISDAGNTDANAEVTGTIVAEPDVPVDEEEVQRALLTRLGALIAIVSDKRRQQPDPDAKKDEKQDIDEGKGKGKGKEKEELPEGKSIRPAHSVLGALTDSQMKRILFSFTVVFCFGPEAEHITASMLQEGEGPSTSGAENGDNVKSGPLFVVFLSKNGPIGKEDEANALREELLEWFNGTGAIDRLRIVERCGEKVLKDADLKKKAINQGCKAFGQEMKIVDETGAGHVVNEIGRLKDTIHAMDADGIFTMAWEVVLSHEGVVSNLYSKLDAAPSDSSKKKNFEAMKACLDALEDLALLGRAHQNLTLFKDTLGRLNAKLEIQFVDIDPVDHVPVAQIREEIKNITEEFQIPPNLVDARKEWANIEHLQRMHGEVKLLTHLNTAMTPLERAQMWRFIACNKKPCYGCFYLVRDAQGYGSEASHYKVFYPWPVPAELARTAGYLDGVRQLISRFEDIIRKACEENDFQQNPPIREMRSGMLSPRNM